jgi:hypothetical protein
MAAGRSFRSPGPKRRAPHFPTKALTAPRPARTAGDGPDYPYLGVTRSCWRWWRSPRSICWMRSWRCSTRAVSAREPWTETKTDDALTERAKTGEVRQVCCSRWLCDRTFHLCALNQPGQSRGYCCCQASPNIGASGCDLATPKGGRTVSWPPPGTIT